MPFSPASLYRKPVTTIRLVFIFTTFTLVGTQHANAQKANSTQVFNMIFTSDVHYGITRPKFRGDTNVISQTVNTAAVKQMNTIPGITVAADNGINSGKKVGSIDYFIVGGDIANREEVPIQSAAVSWKQFVSGYLQGIKLKGNDGKPAKFLLVPGNHDISNAIGFYKPMLPLTDPSSMVGSYNLMMQPKKPMTNEAYNYATDKINYSREINGIHMVFITLWPDSAERIWMEKDLADVPKTTPVFVFTHDQPTCEAKHFTNPLPPYDMTKANRFENLTAEHYKEGAKAANEDGATDIEQRGWVKFLKAHPNIKAYFHGNSNWNEFYTYSGPDKDVSLNVFRVDSPMKGKYSAKDETLLSFQLISVDPAKQMLTVRECLWNTEPQNPAQKVVFGKSETVSYKVD